MAAVQFVDVGAGRPAGVVDTSETDLDFASSPSRNVVEDAPPSADVRLVEVAVDDQVAISIEESDIGVSGSQAI